jgi:hypothetical protein
MTTRLTRSCQLCRLPLLLRPNPYYGTGLAVHEWMYVCPDRGWVEFLKEDAAPRDESPPTTAPDSPRGRRWVAALRSSLASARTFSTSTRRGSDAS